MELLFNHKFLIFYALFYSWAPLWGAHGTEAASGNAMMDSPTFLSIVTSLQARQASTGEPILVTSRP